MNILLVNLSDSMNGAAIAGYSLYKGLKSEGIDARLLVDIANNADDRNIAQCRPRGIIGRKLGSLSATLGLNYVAVNSSRIADHEFYKKADLLNFHNITGGYFNYLSIPKLTKTKPAVFTLHDMWAFTGHCYHSFTCDRWLRGCGNCPYPGTYPAIRADNTALEWKLKNFVYARSRMVVVAPSTWLAGLARQSMLKRFPVHHIPNGIDTTAFQPRDKDHCRALLGLPKGKKRVLMTGADSLTNPVKGFDLLARALQHLPESLKAETIVITMGKRSDAIAGAFGVSTMNFGYVENDTFKSLLYSAADAFVLPTRADNLPLVLQESMACGTPVVSFNVGGIPDLVRPGITGYLAEPGNHLDFSTGVIQLLEDEKLRRQLGCNCREICLKEYTTELQAKRYVDLFRHMVA